ncbi:MAG: glucosamine-6-phosphate deaminase, partial [Desulfobulbaceae bacterium]|nr:glucosamine-6-phosphate deaminase [Desulfobulbaceae bacterium]
SKARALRMAVEEGVNHIWTVSMLQLHPHGIIACDEESTLELRVGTVKYFKEIESHTLATLPVV